MPYRNLLKDEFIVKNIILFVFKNYKKPTTNQIITQMVLGEVEIDYFLMQKCLFDIVKLGWIRTFKEENVFKYELTDMGKDYSGLFENKIPYIIKQKLLFCIKKQNSLELPKSEIKTGIDVSERGEFNVYLKIYEVGDLLFSLNINVGSRELALKTRDHFKKNAMDIYMDTTRNVMKDL